jgi:hypothetical protein
MRRWNLRHRTTGGYSMHAHGRTRRYGATGSGKTHTIMGTVATEQRGLAVRAIEEIMGHPSVSASSGGRIDVQARLAPRALTRMHACIGTALARTPLSPTPRSEARATCEPDTGPRASPDPVLGAKCGGLGQLSALELHIDQMRDLLDRSQQLRLRESAFRYKPRHRRTYSHGACPERLTLHPSGLPAARRALRGTIGAAAFTSRAGPLATQTRSAPRSTSCKPPSARAPPPQQRATRRSLGACSPSLLALRRRLELLR